MGGCQCCFILFSLAWSPSFSPLCCPLACPLALLWVTAPCVLQTLNSAMRHVCEILSTDPDSACIPFEIFSDVYQYLWGLERSGSETEMQSYLASLKLIMCVQGCGRMGACRRTCQGGLGSEGKTG